MEFWRVEFLIDELVFSWLDQILNYKSAIDFFLIILTGYFIHYKTKSFRIEQDRGPFLNT